MGTRVKAMTILAAMVVTFAVLPTLGAAADEPLPDDTYNIVVPGDGSVYSFTVEDGTVTDQSEGVTWFFERNEDEKVIGELTLIVDGTSYKVEIKDDEIEVKVDGDAVVATDDPTDPPTPATSEGPEEPDTDEDGDEADEADETHGDVVSTVAQCAPRGKDAKDLGLPTHGYFVSAAAAGASVEVETADGPTEFPLTTVEEAQTFCDAVPDIMATAQAAIDADADATGDDATPGNGNGNGQDKQDKDTGKPEDTGKPANAGPKDKGND